jgi:hypothetical protein
MFVIFTFTTVEFAATTMPQYTVKYSGGSLSAKSGDDLKLQINSDNVGLSFHHAEIITIPANSITEISYGQEVHRRVGTAIGLAVVSLGIGAFMLLAKSKKHYIGLTWDDQGKKGGVALQANKDEFRGLLAALEGISGKKAVNTDAVK